MDWRTMATEAPSVEELAEEAALWTDPRFLFPTAISLSALLLTAWFGWRRDRRGQDTIERAQRLEDIAQEQEQRAVQQATLADQQHQLALAQEARNKHADELTRREVATQLRVRESFPPTLFAADSWTPAPRQGIEITNHHATLTFTDIDVVAQTTDAPARHIEHVGVLPPGETTLVAIDNPALHVRVIYVADFAGQWELKWADIDPQWCPIVPGGSQAAND